MREASRAPTVSAQRAEEAERLRRPVGRVNRGGPGADRRRVEQRGAGGAAGALADGGAAGRARDRRLARARADLIAGAAARWSLGPLTLPHELARVVVAEQLYRASRSCGASHITRETDAPDDRVVRRVVRRGVPAALPPSRRCRGGAGGGAHPPDDGFQRLARARRGLRGRAARPRLRGGRARCVGLDLSAPCCAGANGDQRPAGAGRHARAADPPGLHGPHGQPVHQLRLFRPGRGACGRAARWSRPCDPAGGS